MNPVEIVKRKRNGDALTKEEVDYFVNSYVSGKLPDYQVSALLMAIYFNGLNEEETSNFTNAYINSGKIVDLTHINKPSADKHSTGGVGDKTSLILAPLVACFDVLVPMISGRGLGHTGGTLDKLESIPGFRINLPIVEFVNNLEKINVCMIGQTDELTPADRKIYALRDVTGTVENIGLITASITSKKIAEGTKSIVYDVKTGIGSTMPSRESAQKLARSLIRTSEDFGQRAIAVLTDMDSPLGYAVGTWLEVKECIEIMNPSIQMPQLSNDLLEVTLFLAGSMLHLAGKANSVEDGIKLAGEKLASGECFRKFIDLVEIQGGNSKLILNPETYSVVKYEEAVYAGENGYLTKMDAMKIGLASVELGCGRKNLSDTIDYPSGILLHKKIGSKVKTGETVYSVLGETIEKVKAAKELLLNSFEIKNAAPKLNSRILEVIN